MTHIREERPGDVPAREALLDAAFGLGRHRKTCARLRRNRRPANGLALVAEHDGRLVGTIRLWHVRAASGHDMLLLGPLAVAADFRALGVGGTLMRHAIAQAKSLGHKAILLVGDAPYYARFGFAHAVVDALALPGPVEAERVLALELVPGSLMGVSGMLAATGEKVRPAARARHQVATAALAA